MSWNVRGLGAAEKRVLVKRTLRKTKAEIVILQETKLESITNRDIVEFMGSSNWEWSYLPSNGTAGGIILLWKDDKVTITNFCFGTYSITVDCVNAEDNFKWKITGLYGPSRRLGRDDFWAELINIGNAATASSIPWLLGGDFNTIKISDDKWGGSNITTSMINFNSFIDAHELVDLPLNGALYTWTNKRELATIMTRIDRFLISHDWAVKYPNVSQRVVTQYTSDHKPLILDIGGNSWGPSPFRFETMWLQTVGFDERVANWWGSYNFSGTAIYSLWCKLKALKADLKKWNKEVLGRVELKIEILQQQIEAHNNVEELIPLSTSAFTERDKLRDEVRKLIFMEEAIWKQKSRITNLQCGDQNTNYFHSFANARKRTNSISALSINGEPNSDKDLIKKEIVDFYSNLYSEEETWRPTLDSLLFPQISASEQIILESPCSELEVLDAINELSQEKAPGPDGYPILFFKHFWNLLKCDLMAVVADFFDYSLLDWRLNTTFITLLPKKQQIEGAGDFRPIALLSSAYKIISKVLSSRLKHVIPKLVSEFQSAYIKGRQITDGILIANELIDSRLKASNPGIICKVDMEKAFDRVSWQYIDHILNMMGFGSRWRRWIQVCLSSASFSVLINGTPCGFFRSSRGVRQGDPLSPLIFDLAMEGLSHMLQRATTLQRISGFKSGPSGTAISHLHYADGDWIQIDYTLSILKCFEIVSGLRINLSKTKLISVDSLPLLPTWVSQFGCGIDTLPSKYLGMPLGANPRDLSTWDPVIENFDKRLGHWQAKLLSKGGKLTLIKSTLSSLPIYFLSTFLAPAEIITTLERKIRNFLWAHNDNEHGYHLVCWEKICTPKENGGLGVKQLSFMNKALLAKWCWRYGSEPDALWRKIIDEKFGKSSPYWMPKSSRLTQGVGCWQRIIKFKKKFNTHQTFVVNSGSDTRFWRDTWVDGGPLKSLYPSLFEISAQKNYTIKKMVVRENNRDEWDLKFRRTLTITELEELQLLLAATIHPPNSQNNLVDTRRWVGPGSSSFTVKSCYNAFTCSTADQDFPSKFVWCKFIPPRVSFFLWTATLNRCLTIDNLHKRNRKIVNRCPLCKCDLETIDHLLIHCPFTWRIWSVFLPCNFWSWCMPQHISSLAKCWYVPSGWSDLAKALWFITPVAICWGVWLERNLRSFQDKEASFLRVLTTIRAFIHSWISITEEGKGVRFTDIVFNWDTFFLSV